MSESMRDARETFLALDCDLPAAVVMLGDDSWHDGVGWYYVDDEYRDEGSCGAFATRDEAVAHAREAGYRILVRAPAAERAP